MFSCFVCEMMEHLLFLLLMNFQVSTDVDELCDDDTRLAY